MDVVARIILPSRSSSSSSSSIMWAIQLANSHAPLRLRISKRPDHQTSPLIYLFTFETAPMPPINSTDLLHLFQPAHPHSSQALRQLRRPENHGKILHQIIPQIQHIRLNMTIHIEIELGTIRRVPRPLGAVAGGKAQGVRMDHTGLQAHGKEISNL